MSRCRDVPLSVILPVYNAENFLGRAIDSILAQSFDSFELIIINDCSRDSSKEILTRYRDPRIRYIENEDNLGVAKTLNKGLSLAHGQYVARMDADDWSAPERFLKQLAFLENNPQVDICGSWVWRRDGNKKFLLRYPVGGDCVSAYLVFGNPLAHPAIMMRRAVFEKHNMLYDPGCPVAQDYELWSRCWKECGLGNVPEPLVEWRQNPGGVTSSRFHLSNATSLAINRKMLALLEMQVSHEELIFHRQVGNGSGVASFGKLTEVSDWLLKLVRINGSRGLFSREGFLQAAAFAWYRVCHNSSGLGLGIWRHYLGSPLRGWYKPGKEEFAYLVANSILKFNKQPTGRLEIDQ